MTTMSKPLLEPENERFAMFQWKERWNNNQGVSACLSQDGPYVFLTTAMGVVIIDMREKSSVEYFINQMTQALNMLAKTREEYNNASTR
jgi:hypothetical protein